MVVQGPDTQEGQLKLSPYEQLLEFTREGSGKIDPYTMHYFSMLRGGGQDINEVAAPMLAMIVEEGFEEIKESATVYGRIGSVIALCATPAQLLRLAQMESIISLEASRPGGDFDTNENA